MLWQTMDTIFILNADSDGAKIQNLFHIHSTSVRLLARKSASAC